MLRCLLSLLLLGKVFAACPCLQSVPTGALDKYTVNGVLQYQGFPYPKGYGLKTCKKHEIDPIPLQPYCGNADGQPNDTQPEWCNDPWCYVDKDNCDLPLKFKSAMFPDSQLYYSFQACGASNSYHEWFDSPQTTHSITDVATLVETYVINARNTLQDTYNELKTTDQCSTTSSCPCTDCAVIPNSAWASDKVNLAGTVFVPRKGVSPAPKSQCLSAITHSVFSRVAAKEYTTQDRVGWMYSGLQADGAYTQWPAMEWCPEPEWDPRFRPWYAATASGPKNVILLIDCSGSMQTAGRIRLAQKAATAVLDTLTWKDNVMIIAFNSGVKATSSDFLQPATDQYKEFLKTWVVSNIVQGGGTNFVIPLTKALSVLTDANQNCHNMILFMTDGEAELSDAEFKDIQTRANAADTVIFGYALGSGADTTKTKRLACDNNGVFHKVNDGGDLSHAMSSYYTYFAAAASFTGVRWVQYLEKTTGNKNEVLAGCTPVYDTSRAVEELNFILGVVCVDVNVVVTLDTLRARPDVKEFLDKVDKDAAACTKSWQGLSEEQIQQALHKIRLTLASNGGGAEVCTNTKGPYDAAATCTASVSLTVLVPLVLALLLK